MRKTALVPGSYDPITIGHEAVIKRTAQIFEKVIVAICTNPEKKYTFTGEERLQMLKAAFADFENISVVFFDGLVSDLAQSYDAVIVKGLRTASDFDYEHLQSESNYMINGSETLFMPSRANEMFVSSTLVRELIKGKKDFSPYVSKGVYKIITEIINNK